MDNVQSTYISYSTFCSLEKYIALASKGFEEKRLVKETRTIKRSVLRIKVVRTKRWEKMLGRGQRKEDILESGKMLQV